MGVTGAGKSSFIQQCIPTVENIVGEDYDSCKIEVFDPAKKDFKLTKQPSHEGLHALSDDV